MKNTTYKLLIELLAASFKGESVPQIEPNVDLERVLTIAKSHRVDNMLFSVLSQNADFMNTELGKKNKTSYLQAIVKEANQQKEAIRVMKAFEDEKIVHMPLKGHIIKNLYPTPDMRQSTDFDIYVPEKFTFDACKVLDNLGYEYDEKTIGYDMHDNYRLGLYTEIEVHKNLMAPDFPNWCRMCKDLLKNMIPEPDCQYRYKFSKEDYYLYMQLHTIKHLKYSSSGIKSIIDIWIYLKNYNDILDWDYINKVLKKYNLEKIDKNLRMLSAYWFDGIIPQDDVIYSLSDYIIESGAFGTKEQYYSGRKVDEKKSQVIIKHIFMPLSEMRIKFPVLKKYPVLLPVMWLYRLIWGVLFKRQVISSNLNKTCNVDEEKVKSLSEFKKELGL